MQPIVQAGNRVHQPALFGASLNRLRRTIRCGIVTLWIEGEKICMCMSPNDSLYPFCTYNEFLLRAYWRGQQGCGVKVGVGRGGGGGGSKYLKGTEYHLRAGAAQRTCEMYLPLQKKQQKQRRGSDCEIYMDHLKPHKKDLPLSASIL